MALAPKRVGESLDFKTTTMADTCQIPSIQVRLSLIFPFILVRFAWDLKQIQQKHDSNIPIVCDLRKKYLVKKLLTSNQLCLKVAKIDMLFPFFQGICFKPHANLISLNGNIKESLT